MARPVLRPAAKRRTARIHSLGDSALLIELGSRIDTALNSRCLAIAAALRGRRGIREAMAGYASVAVHYDPDLTSFKAVSEAADRLLTAKPPPAPTGRLHRIPVVYDGPDLEPAARTLGMGTAELIERHQAPIYRVFMSGFVPGFSYMGPVPAEIRLPRRPVPRTAVPAGSVAIAGAQANIYPLPSPGGWHLLGRTSVKVFLPGSDPPMLLRPGDRVKFFPVDA